MPRAVAETAGEAASGVAPGRRLLDGLVDERDEPLHLFCWLQDMVVGFKVTELYQLGTEMGAMSYRVQLRNPCFGQYLLIGSRFFFVVWWCCNWDLVASEMCQKKPTKLHVLSNFLRCMIVSIAEEPLGLVILFVVRSLLMSSMNLLVGNVCFS
jgi:hypothetical protein